MMTNKPYTKLLFLTRLNKRKQVALSNKVIESHLTLALLGTSAFSTDKREAGPKWSPS